MANAKIMTLEEIDTRIEELQAIVPFLKVEEEKEFYTKYYQPRIVYLYRLKKLFTDK